MTGTEDGVCLKMSSLHDVMLFTLIILASPTLPHLGQPTCVCGASLDTEGVHILKCSLGATTHDDIHDVVVAITRDLGYHIIMEKLQYMCFHPEMVFLINKQQADLVCSRVGVCIHSR